MNNIDLTSSSEDILQKLSYKKQVVFKLCVTLVCLSIKILRLWLKSENEHTIQCAHGTCFVFFFKTKTERKSTFLH